MTAGLESVLAFLEQMKLSPEERSYLTTCGRFPQRVIDYLADMRFTADVHALPEGTVFFQDEPIIRITAPLCQAQLVETRVMNLLQQQILFASKAARCVLAEPLYGIPIFGTMAHSFIEAHMNEQEAFLHFSLANPGNVTLLIDTYDTLRGARKVIETAGKLKQHGIDVKAVRLDSGDILTLSKEVRAILDEGGLTAVRIFVSGNMDEYTIEELLSGGAPIDGFGVGTKRDTSNDAPYLECVYKLMEYEGQARMLEVHGQDYLARP